MVEWLRLVASPSIDFHTIFGPRCTPWVLRLVVIASAFGSVLVPAVGLAPATSRFDFAGPGLVSDSQVGLDLLADTLVLSADAPSNERYAPHPRFGMGQSRGLDLAGAVAVESLATDAEVPPGADLRVEARGAVDGRWTDWTTAEGARGLQGARALQVRVTLLAAPNGASPRVRAVWGRTRPDQAPGVAQAQTIFGPPTVTVWATRIGLVGQATANGHVVQEHDHFVALPSPRVLNTLNRRDYVVRIEYRGRTVEAPVWDIGPWNIRDDYWNPNREDFKDLPRWKSEAEAAFFDGYRGGYDGYGRYVTVPPSIDLADGTFLDDLQMGPNDWVRVTYLWLDAPSPAPRSTPLVIPKTLTPGLSLIAAPGTSTTAPGQKTLSITWNTGGTATGQVYASVDGGPENLFGQGVSGSQTAPVTTGRTYVFRLYDGTSHTTVRAEITPARATSSAPAILLSTSRPPPGASTGNPAVLWDTGDGSMGQVYVASGNLSESLLAQGSSGLQESPWMVAGQTYQLRLYRGTEHNVLMASATVIGPAASIGPAAVPATAPFPAAPPGPAPTGPTRGTIGSSGGLVAASLAGRNVQVIVGIQTMAQLASAVGTGATVEVVIDLAPRVPNQAAAGSLGGGVVVPASGPLDIKATIRSPGGAAVAVSPGTSADVTIDVRLPVTTDASRVNPNGVFTWLQAVYDDTGFLGYLRPPADFDPASNSVAVHVSASSLSGTLFLPGVLVPAWVANFDSDVHIFSGPTREAQDFGVAGPAFTTFPVVGPQVAARVYVFNPATLGNGWIDVSGVGPTGPPSG